MKIICLLIILVELSLIGTKTLTADPSNLKQVFSKAVAGDIIELKSGTYSSVPYGLPSGSNGNPIILRAEKNAKVVFTGNQNNCIFDFRSVSYASIEGPFELKDAFCGVKAMDVTNVKISGLKIHNTQQHGIVISGQNSEVSENEIFDCVMENKKDGKTKEFGWSQCVAAWGKNYNNGFSQNLVFKKNNIYNAYGEGLDFLKCDGCSAISNNITNGFSMNIYLDASRNIILDGNILRVNSDDYNTKWGKACGIGLASESDNDKDVINVLITNNIIIGTRMGIYFFTIGGGGYNNIKIYHNTIWFITASPIWFKQPNNNPTGCEMKNNMIYVDYTNELIPKSAWKIGSNYYYNTDYVPGIYSDTDGGSIATRSLSLSSIFHNKGNCNYYDPNLNVECLKPTSSSSWFKLYHNGAKLSNPVSKDFIGEERSANQPSIGAFESCGNSQGGGDEEEDPTLKDLKVKFKIEYCTYNQGNIKMVGDFCNWNPPNGYTLINEAGCRWSYTMSNPSSNLEFKFVYDKNGAYRWENGSNRSFNFDELKSKVKLSSSGTYRECSYSHYNKLVTLTCSWR